LGAGSEKRAIVVWGALCAITVAQLAEGSIAAGAIGIALLKVRFIVREFMEVRHAPVLLGRLTDVWLALTAALLLAGHLAGAAFPKG
jgi:hypothetical protein